MTGCISIEPRYMKQRNTKRQIDKKLITKILNSEENSKRKVPNQRQNQMIKHIKQMDKNCHISDLVQTFSKQINKIKK